MQTLSEKNLLLFLKLVEDATLRNSSEIQIRGKIALVVELLLDVPDKPNGRLKQYVLSNYQSDLPFVPEIGFLLLDNQAPGEVNLQKVRVLPEWIWSENTAGKQVSVVLSPDLELVIIPNLNKAHCQRAERWLDELERNGFGQPDEFN